MNFKNSYESLNLPPEYYSEEVVKDFMGKYSRHESINLDRATLLKILKELSMRYVDGDDENFDSEVQEIAEKALKKIENGPFNVND